MIINKNKTVGIGFDEERLKMAAIFYDKVIPVIEEIQVPDTLLSEIPIDLGQIQEVVKSDHPKYSKSDTDLLKEIIIPQYFKGNKYVTETQLREVLHTVFEESKSKRINLIILEISRQLQNKSAISIPIYNQSILLNKLLEDYKANQKTSRVEIELLNAPIINSKDISWAQIAEAKKDADFNIKVKRFGVFINKNYSGKDISFISDDLAIQIEDYKNACNKHGIELINGTLKSLSSSKSMFGTMGLVMCGIIANSPEASILTGVIGGILELTNVNVTIKENNDKFNSFIKESPLSLIVELNKMKNST